MSKVKKQITIQSTVPEWMRGEVIAGRMQERVQAVMNKMSFRAPEETVEAIANALIDAYVAGYGDGRGLLEHEPDAEAHAQELAGVILEGEGGDDPDHIAIAGFVRRVAGIIEARGLTAAPAPKGLPS